MAPQQHLQWFDENIGWFEDLPVECLDAAVPNCPGWVVTDVFNHLSLGLGLAYPMAVAAPPTATATEAFADMSAPETAPTGAAAIGAFSANMRSCLGSFRTVDPDRPCWTYPGPGTARFWIRRAAIETAVHRIDVEEALADSPSPLRPDRAVDAIAEAVEFVLPLAAELTDGPAGRLNISSPELDLRLQLGTGPRQAGIMGSGQAVLNALWGRPTVVEVSGDRGLADEWLSLVERAFAGR